MRVSDSAQIVEDAIAEIDETSTESTDGKWLEYLTARVAPHLKEWDLDGAWSWGDWSEREARFPGTTSQDIGIDVVGRRRSDGELVAIQCKSRQLDADGRGADITKREADSFLSSSAESDWSERWMVTNGNVRLSGNVESTLSMSSKPLKLLNVRSDLVSEKMVWDGDLVEECESCGASADPNTAVQSKTCMQNEAVSASVRILREQADSDSGGLPRGQARGKIILPCGTGKTRISLRIVEELTGRGELSVVLCPSIALVAQIRREYLQYSRVPLRALAVCSDETAGHGSRCEDGIDTLKNPMADNGFMGESDVKGKVTTDSAAISRWIRAGEGGDAVSVIFGTYQSGHRVATALQTSKTVAKVLIADEAHRTAGLRRKASRSEKAKNEAREIRNFTLCHDQAAFPATYRVYQTATPKVFDVKPPRGKTDWVVRTMDDESVFGVELYRKSYPEAVRNGWLSDYRIIALGVNDADAYEQANLLATGSELTGRRAITSSQYLRGLAFALAMGGATQNGSRSVDGEGVAINSCIAFLNSVAKSKEMAGTLQSDSVRAWVQKWLHDNADGREVSSYRLEHLDATSKVTERDAAKIRLADATEDSPHAIMNVGIFGEGTDSPSLNAVAFLEARKSPIDVIQAVGRAMRTAPDKSMGYIICPILIPPNADPEKWLSSSEMAEGWTELGQILLALRAHDQRIEDNLSELLQLYLPQEPEVVGTIVGFADQDSRRVEYRWHAGRPGGAEEALERVLDGKSTLKQEFDRIEDRYPADGSDAPGPLAPLDSRLRGNDLGSGRNVLRDAGTVFESGIAMGPAGDTEVGSAPEVVAAPSVVARVETEASAPPLLLAPVEPTQVIAGKKNSDGNTELRLDSVAREKPSGDGTRGSVDIDKSKAKAKKMINEGSGVRLELPSKRRARRRQRDVVDESGMRMLRLSGLEEYGDAIRLNLLVKSGLATDRVQRDLNLLETGIAEATFHLRSDDLVDALNRHFGLDNLNESSLKKQADGCTIASLLLMNAAMLHQRISAGRWLSGISPLSEVKSDVNVVRRLQREWGRILTHDFRPVIEPALETIYEIENTGKTSGLERALRHIAAEAERIAETYADMGADHAGPLFNRVMGNQASDGAFFTRPVAASIAARLTLDAVGEQDWADAEVWRTHKTVDLACGSGTLLAAMLTEMKRRAREQGASEGRIAELQRVGVEETIKGLDINPVSLQLAASQLTTGNQDIRYRRMGLHLMPYGPDRDDPTRVSAGTLELLGQRAIVPRKGQLDMGDDAIESERVWGDGDDAELEDAVESVKDARIVIMNPPFTERVRMGEKFPDHIRNGLRERVDNLEKGLVTADPELEGFVTRRAITPLFVSLAEYCLDQSSGVLAMINPTIICSNSSGLHERRVLAERYHIHTVVTCRQPRNFNLSQNTSINESILILTRQEGAKPPTRFITLDRLPVDENEVEDLHLNLTASTGQVIENGWGEVSYWPQERMKDGDWSAAIWRSPILAEAATHYSNADHGLRPISVNDEISISLTSPQLILDFQSTVNDTPGSFPILKARGADAQLCINGTPDDYRIPKGQDGNVLQLSGGTYPETDKILEKAGYLLITDGQRNSTARLTAVASNEKYVGISWMPVSGLSRKEAKALAVFLNSTAGRLQIMRNASRTIEFPMYRPAALKTVCIPDLKDDWVLDILADCWEWTKDMLVPQFRDGECQVRRLWDDAVVEAMGWDADELARLRHLLHREPHVSGLGYNQYADDVEG